MLPAKIPGNFELEVVWICLTLICCILFTVFPCVRRHIGVVIEVIKLYVVATGLISLVLVIAIYAHLLPDLRSAVSPAAGSAAADAGQCISLSGAGAVVRQWLGSMLLDLVMIEADILDGIKFIGILTAALIGSRFLVHFYYWVFGIKIDYDEAERLRRQIDRSHRRLLVAWSAKPKMVGSGLTVSYRRSSVRSGRTLQGLSVNLPARPLHGLRNTRRHLESVDVYLRSAKLFLRDELDKLFSPWQLVYVSAAKVAIAYAGSTTALLSVGWYFGWILASRFSIIAMSLSITNLMLVTAMAVMIATDRFDRWARRSKRFRWLFQ